MLVRRLFVLLGTVFGMMAATAAVADPRDSVERSQRMDTDALRDDVRQNRLRVPSHPLVIAPAPAPQPVPIYKRKKKSSASSGSNR
ncbi:hypothetical protein [Bradyrhizobium sp. LB11.1]|uniref:hypothetical protein n=1 Tax=Bradyrhizobium sp. LB11.1 TaxID=3156326 RepID=UPI003394FE16